MASVEAHLPRELTIRPQPLITLAGLDSKRNADHRVIADAFTANRRQDRLPLNFQVRPTDHVYPNASPPRQSYEFFHPRGILKKGWLKKHLELVPSVCVLFFDLDWDTEAWSERIQECLSKLQCIRSSLSSRNTRVALVLLQSKTRSPLGDDDMLASERAALLCSACELSSKHLFILPYIDQHLIMGYVQRLETAFFELAQQYYQGETKRVKSRKEFLNKSTHLILFIRHQFKCGFYSEQRQDTTTALQHYVAAYNYLTEVQPTLANSLELRTVASYLNYKICRLCFRGGAPRDALTQFRKHIDQFKGIVYYPELNFEHYAWLAKQFSIFGDLFDEAVRGQGLNPIMNQHPGFYYKQASDYTMARRRAASKHCVEAAAVFNGDIDTSKTIYVGQRPWRVGYKEGQSCSPEDQQEGIYQLQAVEGHAKYSWFIVNALSSAINHFNKHRSPRMRETLRLQLGQEYVLCSDYAKALSVLGHSMDEFRASQWWSFLVTSLKLALRCSYATAQVEDYFTIAVELLGKKFETADEDKVRIQANLERIIANEVPEAEPGCSEEEVEKAVALWRAGIKKSWREDRIVTQPSISVQTPQCNTFLVNALQLVPFVQCKPQFERALFRADETLELRIYLRSLAPKPIKFSKLVVNFSEDMYAPVSTIGEPSAGPLTAGDPSSSTLSAAEVAGESEEGEILLRPGEVGVHTFRFLPPASLLRSAEINGRVEISTIVLHLGSTSSCCARLRWTTAGTDMALPHLTASNNRLVDMWTNDSGRGPSRFDLWDNIPVCPVAEVVSRAGELFLDFSHSPPALVKEFYPVILTVRNDEKHAISSLQLTVSFREEAMVESSHLSLNTPSSAETNVASLTVDIPNMEPEDVITHTVFVQCQQICQRALVVSANYGMAIPPADGEEGRHLLFQSSTSVDIQSVHPFEASVKMTSLKIESIDSVHKGEEFLLTVEMCCTSPWPITVTNTSTELSQPFTRAHDASPPESQLSNVHLQEGDTAAECYCLLVPASAVQKGSIPLGHFSVDWHRMAASGEKSGCVPIRTVLALPAASVMDVPFVLTAALPSHGRVRSLLPLSFTLRNQTALIQEVELAVESSDSFMYAGKSKARVRVAAHSELVMDYSLYPNVPGFLALPRLRFKWLRQDFDEQLVKRSLPTHVFVMPLSS